MHQTSPSDTRRSYIPLQTNSHHFNNEYSQQQSPNLPSSNVLPGISTQQPNGLISLSQPGTPKPDMISSPPDKLSSMTSPDLIRRRPPLPSRPASFTTTTFHSNPYPNSDMPLRRRRTETSMFSFESGPTFSQTKQLIELWNMDQTNGYQVQLHAKMDRGFFRADQDWTCYRRNYFQVSSTFDIHGMNYVLQGPEVPCLVRTDNQELFQIDFFTIGVSARVSGSDKKIELVQHTPKRDKGPQMIPEPRVVSAGGNLHLASVGSNHNIVTFERMQFKTATANNGKRRAAQQYYEIVVDLYANSATGKSFKVATSVSAPLVVRGRSPGHYADSHTRYRSMDAGQASSVPFAGSGANSSSVSSTATSSNSTSVNQRYNLPTTTDNNHSNNFYTPYQPAPLSSSYPYHIGGFAPILNAPNEKESNHRRDSAGYGMHHYNPLPPSTNDDYNNNTNSYDHSTDNKSYWMNRESNNSEQQHRYSSTSPYEFSNYHMRPMSTDNDNGTSTNSESVNNNRNYLQQHHH